MSSEDSAIEVTDVAAIFGAVASGVQPRVAGIPAMDEGAFGADAGDTQRARTAVMKLVLECSGYATSGPTSGGSHRLVGRLLILRLPWVSRRPCVVG